MRDRNVGVLLTWAYVVLLFAWEEGRAATFSSYAYSSCRFSVLTWWREKDMRGRKYRDGMSRFDWPGIEIASLDYLISEGVEISTRGELVEPLF
jgi:hypothetical protein